VTQDNMFGDPAGQAATVAFSQRGDDATKELERILEVPLRIHVELGSRRMKVRELLEVTSGSIVELDTIAGTPLEIFANDTLVAQGEAVVAGEHYGVRITAIVSLNERFSSLGQHKK
jgi:flagellar motor switch protein FliN